MALEFALRPRINLERPAPQRRLRRLRLPPLALPIVAYWLGIAGATHAFLRSAVVEEAADGAQVTEAPPDSEVADVPLSVAPAVPSGSLPTGVLNTDTDAPAEPLFEPAAPAAPAEPAAAPLEREAPALASTPREQPSRAHHVLMPEADTPPVLTPAPLRTRERPAASVRSEESEAPRVEAPKLALHEQPTRDEGPAGPLPSCESAAATANETIDLGSKRGAPDISRDAFATVLDNGAYLARCAVPARTMLEICAAVRDGKVIGVSATTSPRSPAVNACVRRAVADLRFPRNSRLDVTHTRFEPSP